MNKEKELGGNNGTTEQTFGNDESETIKKYSFRERFTNFKLREFIIQVVSFFTIEPYLLCYLLPNMISAVTVYQLNLEKACMADLNYTTDVCEQALQGNTSTNETLNAVTEASILVTQMTSWKTPIQSAVPAVTILFVGAWSDRTGKRKILMLLPLAGEIISSVGIILAVYYFNEWPLWITGVMEGIPPAFTGGISVALMSSYSYLADITTVESRTFRMGVVGSIVAISIPLGTAISGVLTTYAGYYVVFGLGLVIYIIGFLHTCIRIHDVKKIESAKESFLKKLVDFFHIRNVSNTVSFFFKKSSRRRNQIILILIVHVVLMGPVYGEGQLTYYYVLKKYSMDILQYSMFTTYQILLGSLGTMIAVSLFSKWLKLHDTLIGIIGTACKVVSSLVYGLAPDTSWFYAGPAFDLFGNTGVPIVRSLSTKVVDPDEVGKIISVIGFIDAIAQAVASPIYNTIYENTVENLSGAFYLVGAVLTVPAFGIFWILFIMQKKNQRDHVKNPNEKELYAHDNEVTEL